MFKNQISRLILGKVCLNNCQSSATHIDLLTTTRRGVKVLAKGKLKLSTINNNNNIEKNRIYYSLKRIQLTQFTTKRYTSSVQILRPYVDQTMSYVFGRSHEQLEYSTVDREFRNKIKEFPDEIAFASYFENKEVTFKELDEDVNKVTKALIKKFKLKKGDSVGVFAYNCYNWIVIQMACARLGAILTPINPSYKVHELEYLLKKSHVKCLFLPGPKSTQSIELNNHLGLLQSEKIIDISHREGELFLENVIFMDHDKEYNIINSNNNNNDKDSIKCLINNCKMYNWSYINEDNDGKIFKTLEEAKESGLYSKPEVEACIYDNDNIVSPDDLFAIYYTSGTTGTPKGACISHFTCINNVKLCQNRLRHGRSKNWKAVNVTTLPMFHIFAGVLNTLSPMVNNCRIIYSSYKYDIKAMVEAIIKYQANVITLTPTILIDMLTYIETNKVLNFPLKIVQSGGAHLSPEVVNKTFKTLPELEELRLGYGSTENGGVATLQTIHEPNEMRSMTVGPPLDFTEVRIVEPNSNKLVPLGVRGEIQTRGYNTMMGYFKDDKKTSEVRTESRWYKTGDIGLMHPHGSIQIAGRLKSLIIKGGENIYPEEVELMIHKLDYVEDVHVVGVPDKRFGEQVCAWVKLKPGYTETKTKGDNRNDKQIHKDDIIEFCKENITYFKVPKYLLFVQEFPLTPTKKVQSHIMTEQSIKILNLQDQL